jgi:hypothetical protein
MAIIDHGKWERYAPNPPVENLPANVMFARRVGDNVDWYEYVSSNHFQDGSVVMTVQRVADGAVIQAATRDPTEIFPAPFSVIEETEYTGTDPLKDFGRRMYDADLRKVGDLYVPPRRPSSS